MNRPSAHLPIAILAAISLLTSACQAAVGDVSFRAASKTVPLNPGGLNFAVDVLVDVAGGANVPATGWGMIVNVTPGAGATGTVQFNPPPIVNDEPNLMPASHNPFIDFDRDFGGKSYGTLGDSATQLHAFSHYFAPTMGPAPPLDANGNLSLPSGRGLVSLPLVASANASGHFNITFDPDTEVTGVVFATGQPAPDDIGIHPAGTHVAGLLNVLNPVGDYNHNHVVDAADYVVWRKTFGQNGAALAADGSGNGTIDNGDFDLWRSHFGQTLGSGAAAGSSSNTTVPEPASALLLILGAIAGICTGPRRFKIADATALMSTMRSEVHTAKPWEGS
jgi:hypothetical protein